MNKSTSHNSVFPTLTVNRKDVNVGIRRTFCETVRKSTAPPCADLGNTIILLVDEVFILEVVRI